MVLGLLPIVGAPLPIMSYGGSSMLSIMMGFGIVMSCKIYNQHEDIWRRNIFVLTTYDCILNPKLFDFSFFKIATLCLNSLYV